MNKRLVWNVLKYLLGPCLLAWIVWQNWNGIAEALHNPIQPGPLVAALALYVFGILLTFWRWFVLVRAQDLPLTAWNAFRLGLLGFFLSTFLPGSIGGDVVKAAFLAKDQRRRTVAVATVLVDRIVGLWGLFWIVAILGTVFWAAGDPALRDNASLVYVYVASLGVAGGSVVTWLLMGLLPEWRAQRFAGRLERLPKVGHSAAEFWRAIWMYRRKGGSIALALGMSIAGHVGFVTAFYYSARVLFTADVVPSMAEHFLFVPIGMTWAAVCPSPGGFGFGELGYRELYKLVLGADAGPRGVLVSLVARVIGWGPALVAYFIYLYSKPSPVEDLYAPGPASSIEVLSPVGAVVPAATSPVE